MAGPRPEPSGEGDSGPGDRLIDGVPPSLRDRALLLPVAGFFLAMPPLVMIFSRDIMVLGVPLLYFYLFGLWCLLIIGGARLARHLQWADAQPTIIAQKAPGAMASPAPDDPPEGSADAR